jgi:hypothetical protein
MGTFCKAVNALNASIQTPTVKVVNPTTWATVSNANSVTFLAPIANALNASPAVPGVSAVMCVIVAAKATF